MKMRVVKLKNGEEARHGYRGEPARQSVFDLHPDLSRAELHRERVPQLREKSEVPRNSIFIRMSFVIVGAEFNTVFGCIGTDFRKREPKSGVTKHSIFR